MERPLRVRSPATILVLAQGQSGPAHPTRSSLGQFGPGHPDRPWEQFGPGHPVRSWGQFGPGHPERSSGQFGPGHPDRFRRAALFDPRQTPSCVLQPLKLHPQHVASRVHCTPWPGAFSKHKPSTTSEFAWTPNRTSDNWEFRLPGARPGSAESPPHEGRNCLSSGIVAASRQPTMAVIRMRAPV